MPSECVPAWCGKFRFPSSHGHMSLSRLATCMDVTREPLTLQAHANSVYNRESPCVQRMYWEADSWMDLKCLTSLLSRLSLVICSQVIIGSINAKWKEFLCECYKYRIKRLQFVFEALAWKRKLNGISTKPQAFSSQLTQPYVFQTLTRVWSVKLFIDLWSLWVSYHFRAVNLMCLLSFVNDLCGVCVCMCCVSICARCQCVEPCHRV